MQTISFFFACIFFSTKNILDLLIYNNMLIFYHRNLILQFFKIFCVHLFLYDVRILYQTWTPPIYTSNRFVSLSMQIYHLTFNLRISEVSVNDVAMKNTFSNERKKKIYIYIQSEFHGENTFSSIWLRICLRKNVYNQLNEEQKIQEQLNDKLKTKRKHDQIIILMCWKCSAFHGLSMLFVPFLMNFIEFYIARMNNFEKKNNQ